MPSPPKRKQGYRSTREKSKVTRRMKLLQETAEQREKRIAAVKLYMRRKTGAAHYYDFTQIEMCEELYETIRNHKTPEGRLLCRSFIRAPNRMSLPDYFDIVTSPIDLLKIQQKLKTRTYKNIREFTSDMELLVNNVKSYYKKSSQVYQDACELWKVFSDAKTRKEKEKSKGIDDDTVHRRHLPICNVRFKHLYKTVKEFINSQGRKLSESFQKLPNRRCNPYYYRIVQEPTSLNMIEKKIKDRRYSILVEVVDDMNCIFENAKQYDSGDSKLFKDAVELQKVMQAKARKLLYSYIKKTRRMITGYILFSSEVRRSVIATNPKTTDVGITEILVKLWRQLTKNHKKFYEECAQKQDEEALAQLLSEGMPRSPAGPSDKYDNHLCELDICDLSLAYTIAQLEVPQKTSIKQEFNLLDDGTKLPFINTSSELTRIEMKFYLDQDENTTTPGSLPSDKHTAMDVNESIATTPGALAHDQTYLQWSSGQLSSSDVTLTCGRALTDTFPVYLNLVKEEPVDLDLVKEEVNDKTLCH